MHLPRPKSSISYSDQQPVSTTLDSKMEQANTSIAEINRQLARQGVAVPQTTPPDQTQTINAAGGDVRPFNCYASQNHMSITIWMAKDAEVSNN